MSSNQLAEGGRLFHDGGKHVIPGVIGISFELSYFLHRVFVKCGNVIVKVKSSKENGKKSDRTQGNGYSRHTRTGYLNYPWLIQEINEGTNHIWNGSRWMSVMFQIAIFYSVMRYVLATAKRCLVGFPLLTFLAANNSPVRLPSI